MSRVFSLKDVAEHGTKEAPWTIIHDKVYNLTEFLSKVCIPPHSDSFMYIILLYVM